MKFQETSQSARPLADTGLSILSTQRRFSFLILFDGKNLRVPVTVWSSEDPLRFFQGLVNYQVEFDDIVL